MGDQTFARLIKRRRDALGFSQARLAELVGRSASTIRNWERGTSTPAERADAVALAAVLGLDERQVLEGAGFEVEESGTGETVEQGYASLAPPPPQPPPAAVEEKTETEPPGDPPLPPEGERPGVDEESFWGPNEPSVGPSETERAPEASTGRRLTRAARPTVLEAAPPGEPSYLEDVEERQRYRVRAVATAALVIGLFIVLLWSFDRATDALGSLWDSFVGQLRI
jgi:transcriptional regulator with XRE-family HTH domain